LQYFFLALNGNVDLVLKLLST